MLQQFPIFNNDVPNLNNIICNKYEAYLKAIRDNNIMSFYINSCFVFF